MRIREAALHDAEAMGQVTVDTFLAAHRGQIPDEVWEARRRNWTPEVSAQNWARALREIAEASPQSECIYVAEDENGEIVGVAMGVPDDADMSGLTAQVCVLYVLSGHHGQGIGRRLVAAVAARMAGWGRTAMTIEVLKTNAPARGFYEALGGQLVGERDVEDEGVMLPQVIYGWLDIRALLPAG
jgi:ribosomal protein S18 acetylase RimI-like enzyme